MRFVLLLITVARTNCDNGAGWHDDGTGFCEAPAGFDTKCATSYDFAEATLFIVELVLSSDASMILCCAR